MFGITSTSHTRMTSNFGKIQPINGQTYAK